VSEEIDRKSVVDATFEEWDVIDALLSEIDPEQWRLPVPLPGWDVHATVAHLIGTESMLLGIDPPTAETVAADHVRNPIGAFNEQWVRGLDALTGAQMLDRFRAVTERRRAALSALTDEQWNEIAPTTPVGPAPYGRFMRIRLFDCWMHELDLRDAVARPGDEGGARGDLALAEIVPLLGFTIGKRGKAPVGSRIALHLTGPLARDIYLDVPERARLVAALDGPATVAITLDSGLFARLFGGRTTATAHADAIAVTGDESLGRRLLDNLATTI
jgi:uncharacterized protein (TIGR03083 family)